MSDNIFDRLIDLLQSDGPVNWKLAREIATSIAGQPQPVDPALTAEYRELARAAQLHVSALSGLDASGLPEVSVVDRAGWAVANLQGFRYLIEPIAAGITDNAQAGPLDAVLRPLAPALLGMQMGSMVGFLSQRVMGQFDVGLPPAGTAALYFVAPNIEAFASDHGIDPSQARLWVALHEVTHHAEFQVRWVRPHFLSLVAAYVENLDFDPGRIAARLETLTDPAELESMFRDPAGIAGLVAGPEQQEALQRIQAFMALVEGYAEHVMDRAGPQLIPDAPRLREALDRRRAEPSQGEEILRQILGLELKRQQYRLGAAFCDEVARRWGPDALGAVWEAPENIPTLAELEDPLGWAARVLVDDIGTVPDPE